MGRGKIKRKSTAIDMTAMCDVAFLLLSFFILTAQFKPSEAVPIDIPNSVHSQAAKLSTDAFVVSVDKDGKTVLELSDAGIRSNILQKMEEIRGFQLTPAQTKAFINADYISVSVSQLPQFLSLNTDQLKSIKFTGIPMDSTGGELRDWITAGLQAYDNDTKLIHFIIKGDNSSKYPNIGNVISAFKKNEVYKYQLLTSPEAAPPGTELYKQQMSGKKNAEDED